MPRSSEPLPNALRLPSSSLVHRVSQGASPGPPPGRPGAYDEIPGTLVVSGLLCCAPEEVL